MSKYVVNLFEHELHEGRFVVNMFVAPCTYESRGIINFMFQCVEDLVSCILMCAYQFDEGLNPFNFKLPFICCIISKSPFLCFCACILVQSN